jgi:hypothetical protein
MAVYLGKRTLKACKGWSTMRNAKQNVHAGRCDPVDVSQKARPVVSKPCRPMHALWHQRHAFLQRGMAKRILQLWHQAVHCSLVHVGSWRIRSLSYAPTYHVALHRLFISQAMECTASSVALGVDIPTTC